MLLVEARRQSVVGISKGAEVDVKRYGWAWHVLGWDFGRGICCVSLFKVTFRVYNLEYLGKTVKFICE